MMSWQVDGVWYHDSAAYQRATIERDRRLALAEADSLRNEAAQHRRRAESAERELRSAVGNLQRQQQLQAELSTHVGNLERTQERLRRSQKEAEDRMDRQFQDVRRTAQQTQANVAALERNHQEHVRQVQAAFAESRAELAAGLQEAERRRAQTEQVLQAEIRQVDDKVEADRRERLEKARSDTERARVQIAEVSRRLPAVVARRDELQLHAEATDIETALRKAGQYLDGNDATQALVEANAADRALIRAERELFRKDAALHAQRTWVTTTAGDLLAQLARTDAAGENQVTTFFPREAAVAAAALNVIVERTPRAYAEYGQLAVQRPQDERNLAELEQAVRLMTITAPQAREMFLQRVGKVNEIMDQLRERFGLETQITTQLTNQEDPKSPQVIHCDYGGAMVDVYVPLRPDGKVHIEGYGHRTDAECASSGLQMTQLVAGQAQLATVQRDVHARRTPQLQPREEAEPWSGLSEQLSRVNGRL